jgi:signal transduction histidine kinase
MGIPQERRDFGRLLRHELNNPLTGILGNAELRRSNIELIAADRVAIGDHRHAGSADARRFAG